jgi:hypothetical protein
MKECYRLMVTSLGKVLELGLRSKDEKEAIALPL